MRDNRKLVRCWAVFHITFIIVICAYSAYHKYCRFYKVKENTLIKQVNAVLFFNKPILYYGKLTGTETGYGFFAPNIKSNGIIIGDCDGKKIYPRFTNFEAMMRFSILSSRVTDYLISSDESADVRDKETKVKFYNLVFKSIAVKLYNQNKCRHDTMFMSYSIIEFPALSEYKKGHHTYSLQRIKEMRLVKQ